MPPVNLSANPDFNHRRYPQRRDLLRNPERELDSSPSAPPQTPLFANDSGDISANHTRPKVYDAVSYAAKFKADLLSLKTDGIGPETKPPPSIPDEAASHSELGRLPEFCAKLAALLFYLGSGDRRSARAAASALDIEIMEEAFEQRGQQRREFAVEASHSPRDLMANIRSLIDAAGSGHDTAATTAVVGIAREVRTSLGAEATDLESSTAAQRRSLANADSGDVGIVKAAAAYEVLMALANS